MCSIVVGIGVGWGISIVGMAVGTSSEEIRWGGNELCGNRVRMGKMSAGRGGDGYEISHQCFCTDGLRFRITPPPRVYVRRMLPQSQIYTALHCNHIHHRVLSVQYGHSGMGCVCPSPCHYVFPHGKRKTIWYTLAWVQFGVQKVKVKVAATENSIVV